MYQTTHLSSHCPQPNWQRSPKIGSTQLKISFILSCCLLIALIALVCLPMLNITPSLPAPWTHFIIPATACAVILSIVWFIGNLLFTIHAKKNRHNPLIEDPSPTTLQPINFPSLDSSSHDTVIQSPTSSGILRDITSTKQNDTPILQSSEHPERQDYNLRNLQEINQELEAIAQQSNARETAEASRKILCTIVKKTMELMTDLIIDFKKVQNKPLSSSEVNQMLTHFSVTTNALLSIINDELFSSEGTCRVAFHFSLVSFLKQSIHPLLGESTSPFETSKNIEDFLNTCLDLNIKALKPQTTGPTVPHSIVLSNQVTLLVFLERVLEKKQAPKKQQEIYKKISTQFQDLKTQHAEIKKILTNPKKTQEEKEEKKRKYKANVIKFFYYFLVEQECSIPIRDRLVSSTTAQAFTDIWQGYLFHYNKDEKPLLNLLEILTESFTQLTWILQQTKTSSFKGTLWLLATAPSRLVEPMVPKKFKAQLDKKADFFTADQRKKITKAIEEIAFEITSIIQAIVKPDTPLKDWRQDLFLKLDPFCQLFNKKEALSESWEKPNLLNFYANFLWKIKTAILPNS